MDQIDFRLIPWGSIVSILGSLATIFGMILGLLKFYFRQQIKLDMSRKETFEAQAKLLEIQLADVKSDFNQVMSQLDLMIKNYQAQKVVAEKVYFALGEFVVSVKEKFKKYDDVQKPETYNKTEVKTEVQTEAKPSNFGKVKVED